METEDKKTVQRERAGDIKKGTSGETRKKVPAWLIVLTVIAAILLAVCVAALVLFEKYYNSSNFVADQDVPTIDLESLAAEMEADSAKEQTPVIDNATVENEEEIISEIEEDTADLEDIPEFEGMYNLLLVGSDRRSTDWYGNSDAMVLVTINSNTKKIYLTSFMRDLYANIPDVGVRKLNNAYARGGGPLLCQTIANNYGVNIVNYASLDFFQMMGIIDLMGCIDIPVSAGDSKSANGSVWGICKLRGLDTASNLINEAGASHLSGIQAVAYSRIRHYGNADFERTSRQRMVLEAILKKLKNLGAASTAGMVDDVLPLITHNVEQSTILELIADLPSILGYDIEQHRVPADGTYYSSNEILIPVSMSDTIAELRNTIYSTGE